MSAETHKGSGEIVFGIDSLIPFLRPGYQPAPPFDPVFEDANFRNFAAPLASRHGITGLVYLRLRKHEKALGSGFQLIKDSWIDQGKRNFARTVQLLEVLRQFRSAGIPVMLLRGPALALQSYGDLSARVFKDFDLLIRRRDIDRSRALLESSGYRPKHRLNPAQDASFQRTEHNYIYTHDNLGMKIELHWQFFESWFSVRLDSDSIWSRGQTLDLLGFPALVMADDDQALLLAVHGGKHLWTRLEWLCSFAYFIHSRPGLDWGRVQSMAAASGTRRFLELALELSESVLDVHRPALLGPRRGNDALVKESAIRIRSRWNHPSEIDPGASETVPFHLRHRERLRDRVLYLGSHLFSPSTEDWREMPLPAGWFPAYYFLRPLRLAGKHLRRAIARGR